jgi:predicted nucleic acid-binding protein
VRRGELTTAEARLIWGGLERQPITIFPSNLVIEPALEVAFDTDRTIYDSCYLALAMLVDCQLVTADQRLFSALQDGSYAIHMCWVAGLP